MSDGLSWMFVFFLSIQNTSNNLLNNNYYTMKWGIMCMGLSHRHIVSKYTGKYETKACRRNYTLDMAI